MITRYLYIAIFLAAMSGGLFAWHKYQVHESYKDGREDQRAEQDAANIKYIQEQIAKAEQEWIAANKHVETVTKVKTEIKEVVRNVIQKVEVPIDTCTYLGDDWLSERNAAIDYLRAQNSN